MEKNDIFGSSPQASSTPKDTKRKKMQLSMDFNASSNQVLSSQQSQYVLYESEAPIATDTNKEVMDMLALILEKQISIESRLEKLEENTVPKTDVMAHQKVLRESKVLLKRTHQMVCRISGESGDDLHTEMATLMPLQSLDAVFDVEEKMAEKSFEDAVTTFLFTLKGSTRDIGGVMKRIFSDEVLSVFNWDGRCGKKALQKLKLVNVALFDILKLQGRIQFEKQVRKNVELSHNRNKQKRYLQSKNNIYTNN